MPPYLSPLHIVKPTIPASCEPANIFLYHLSATFHTCVPTNLALVSTLLGACSIISWLFAQLPQIYKNHKLKSTSGLSAFFLTEWLLGDVTNLLGCLFTGQASWQIIIAGYYVFVDCCLCAQWVWYEMLHHGRPLRPIWGRWSASENSSGPSGPSGMHQVWNGAGNPAKETDPPKDSNHPTDKKDAPNSAGKNVPHSKPMDAFRMPNFARSPTPAKESWQNSQSGTSPHPHVRRVAASSSPMPSPKTVLYISLVLAVLSNTSTATPVSPFAPVPYRLSARTASSEPSLSASELAGKIFSWMSTFLYLGSRLPQLYKNQVRKSTAGLSPALFAAAFFGNLFYSSSLLTNPCAWFDYAPGQGSGWVGPSGSIRNDWVLRATPFFLGAAGVLLMDAAVGLQFVYFGDNEPRGRSALPRDDIDEVIITVDDHGRPLRRRLHWRRVSGWMRGWAPAVSVAATPSASRAATPVDTPREASPASSAGGESSKSIPIRGKSNALDEARALLGTSRHASPRSYGAVGSPRSPAA
ncbi:Nn.00g000740.m01.CDS01 [Neocucurbitaria sp. VM-36]